MLCLFEYNQNTLNFITEDVVLPKLKFIGVRRVCYRFIFLALLLPLLIIASAQFSFSQNVFEEQQENIAQLKQEVGQLVDELNLNPNNDEALSSLRLRFDALSKKLSSNSAPFRPRLAEINAKLEELGQPASDAGEEEPPVVAEERQRLQSEKTTLNALISDSDNTASIIDKQISKIVEMRRALFTESLSQRVNINLALASQVVEAAQIQMQMLSITTTSWWNYVANYKLAGLLSAIFASLLAGFGFSILAKRSLKDYFTKDPDDTEPSYLRRLIVAFGATVVPSASCALSLISAYFLLNYFNILRADIGVLIRDLFKASGLIYFIHRLAVSIFSPSLPQWSLIPLQNKKNRYILTGLITTMITVYGIDYFFASVSQLYASPLSLTIAKSLITSLIIGGIIIVIAIIWPRKNTEDGRTKSWPGFIKITIFALGILTILSALIGYVGFARFISQQVIVTGAFLLTMYLGFQVAKAISEERAFAHTQFGQRLQSSKHFDEYTLDKFGLLVGLIINLAVLAVGVPLILSQFGFHWDEIQKLLYDLIIGFKVGNITISFAGIITGILLFILGYFLTRWFQGWLDGNVMQRGRVDAGVRNSVRTIVGYLGLSIAALVGISAAGFNLSNLALIAGGLSLGIGFGLQTIVQNFVSGLILLTERPFKVGDWIEAGGVSGTVKKISVRSTEVETFARQSVVVPNSSLINGNVANWTLHNKLGRIEILVETLYTPDPRRVCELLGEIARENTSILKNPSPFISFNEMQADGFSFVIYAYVADITSTGAIRTELRCTVVERFEAEGIKLKSCFRNEILTSKILQ